MSDDPHFQESHLPPLIVDGRPVSHEELDHSAHVLLHSPRATTTEVGMATVMLALLDERVVALALQDPA